MAICDALYDDTQDRLDAADKENADYQASCDEYYRTTVAIVMVPVPVKYHYATGVIHGINLPTKEDVEKLFRERNG